MRQDLRDSGIVPLGRVPWGTHICQFYENKDEMLEVLVPYFAAGLRDGEYCVWVCSAPLPVDEAEASLREAYPRLDDCLASGQMTILPYDRWYLDENGRFNAPDVLGRWKAKIRQARDAGFAGIRATGNTTWLSNENWKAFADYESRLYGTIAQDPIVALCTYSLTGLCNTQVMDVVATHQYALVRSGGTWDLVDCGRHWEKQWETLFDEMLTGVLLVDEQANILAANATTLRCFGVQSLRELGCSLSGLSQLFDVRPDSSESPFTLSGILGTDMDPVRNWQARPAGASRQVDLLISAREIRPSPLASRRYLIVIQDITEIRNRERDRDQFVQVMGHEIRNPLQVMKAAVQLMATETAGSPRSERYLKTMSNQLESLTSLVEDLFTACRVDGRAIRLDLVRTDVKDLVTEWIDARIPCTEREIVYAFAADVSAPVNVDRTRVREILDNILSNSSKYSEPGTRVWIDIRTTGEHALIVVEDEGMGIPDGERDLIFDAFYRASNSSRAGKDGAGLGLYISRQLARMHGGDLWAEARPDGGTIMKLRLPLCFSGSSAGDYAPGFPHTFSREANTDH